MILKIVSGGQTGVDRAALDVALKFDIPCGGWCPKGRKAEDGPIAIKYPLQETDTAEYAQRTKLNVRDSDGTLILTWGKPQGGTLLTVKLAQKLHKPYLVINMQENQNVNSVIKWIEQDNIKVLNIAGPRQSFAAFVYKEASAFLTKIMEGNNYAKRASK